MRTHLPGLCSSVLLHHAITRAWASNPRPAFQDRMLQRRLELSNSHHISQSSRALQQTNDEGSLSVWTAMRIHVDTSNWVVPAADSSTIDSIQAAATFWSEALQVQAIPGQNWSIATDLLEEREFCGPAQVPLDHVLYGLPDTDFVLYVSSSSTMNEKDNNEILCTGSDRLFPLPCGFNAIDRPTAGVLHICSTLDTAAAPHPDTINLLMIREMTKLFAMSKLHFPFFWSHDTGLPQTPRPFVQSGKPTVATNVVVSNTVVTPRVTQVARNHLDCQTLPGAPLEQETNYYNGTWWDERLFRQEIMATLSDGIQSWDLPLVTPLTLALLEDSGWYQVDYSVSRPAPWGLQSGCYFVTEPCLTTSSSETQVPDSVRDIFCTSTGQKGCSSDHSSRRACQVLDYRLLGNGMNLPDHSYFVNDPHLGGLPALDYCPIYSGTYDASTALELTCTDASNAPTFNLYSQVFGPQSQCIASSTDEGLCYRTICDSASRQLRINIAGQWFSCEEDFGSIRVSVGAGRIPITLTCPRFAAVCPELVACPLHCSGRGVCRYNGNDAPVCECANPNDTTPGCSESFVSSMNFRGDSHGGAPASVPNNPTLAPSVNPVPTSSPTMKATPSQSPTRRPSIPPTVIGSSPTGPTNGPSMVQTPEPTHPPTQRPAIPPTSIATPSGPTTPQPTIVLQQSSIPTQLSPPSHAPSFSPLSSVSPTILEGVPSHFPSERRQNVSDVVDDSPSSMPSSVSSFLNTTVASHKPSDVPSDKPSDVPSDVPTNTIFSDVPSNVPSAQQLFSLGSMPPSMDPSSPLSSSSGITSSARGQTMITSGIALGSFLGWMFGIVAVLVS